MEELLRQVYGERETLGGCANAVEAFPVGQSYEISQVQCQLSGVESLRDVGLKMREFVSTGVMVGTAFLQLRVSEWMILLRRGLNHKRNWWNH